MPERRSGGWVFRDTRMPVATVFENLEGGATIEEIIEQYDVTREQIQMVLEFAARSLHAPVPASATNLTDAHTLCSGRIPRSHRIVSRPRGDRGAKTQVGGDFERCLTQGGQRCWIRALGDNGQEPSLPTKPFQQKNFDCRPWTIALVARQTVS